MDSTQATTNNDHPSQFSLHSVAPILLFLVVNRIAGLRWAVILATVLSLGLIAQRRKQGLPLGKFFPVITAAVLVRGAIGAITESEAIYFGLGIAAKYVGAAVLLGSVAVSRPIAARAAPFVMDIPAAARSHKRFNAAMGTITALAGLYYIVSATVDIWLFRRTSVEGFVALRFLTNWPLGAVTLLAMLGAAQHHLSKIPGISSVTELIEHKMAVEQPPIQPPHPEEPLP